MKTSQEKLSLPLTGQDSEPEAFFSLLCRTIHTVVAATADDRGLPVTCAIDIMDYDDRNLYFLTARGKGFYQRLKARPFMSLTGIMGHDTMSSAAVTVRGRVEELDETVLNRLLQKNAYMYEIYPSAESRKALSAFRLCDGSGEYFDLSVRPVFRKQFVFGCGSDAGPCRFVITDKCTGCGLCLSACPQQCIESGNVPFSIRSSSCLMCGRCADICPAGALRKED